MTIRAIRKNLIDIIETNNYSELYNYLLENNFKYLDDHNEIIYYATIYKFINNNNTAGYVWLYELEQPKEYMVHLYIHDDYKGKTLTRFVVNKFYEMTAQYADKLIAEWESWEDLKKSARAKLVAGQPLTEEEAKTFII